MNYPDLYQRFSFYPYLIFLGMVSLYLFSFAGISVDEEGAMIPQDLTYDFPQAAFAFFLVFLFPVLFWVLFSDRKETLNRLAEPSILSQIMVPRSPTIFWMKALALGIIWILAVAAFMQPKGNAHYPEEDHQ